MKRIKSSPIFSGLLILALVVGGYFLIKSNRDSNIEVETPIANMETEESAKVVNLSLVEERTYKVPDSYATFDVVYPEFKNAGAEFNQSISDLAIAGIAQHKKVSEDSWKARYETSSEGDGINEFPTEGEKFQFYMSWTPVQVNEEFISVLVTVGGYTGGAHGYQNLISFNYDVVNKKDVKLSDLFPGNSNYLKTVSDFSRKDLTTQFRKKLEVKTKDDEKVFQGSVIPMMLAGTTPESLNFSVFTFTKDAVKLYFTQYQVAPYAMGESVVVLSRK